jgi:hypothetical protein
MMRLPLDRSSKGQATRALLLLAVVCAVASLPRMKARRNGLITNTAINAAVALSATAMTNTACQPNFADTRLAIGTSSAAVPFAV